MFPMVAGEGEPAAEGAPGAHEQLVSGTNAGLYFNALAQLDRLEADTGCKFSPKYRALMARKQAESRGEL